MRTVRLVDDGLPELQAARWQSFVDDEPETLLQDLGIVLAYSDALNHPTFVVGLWTEDERDLRGVAVATLTTSASGKAVLGVGLPGLMRQGRLPGVWVARGESEADVTRELLMELTAHAQTSGAHSLYVPAFPAAAEAVAAAVKGLGFRELPSEPAYEIHLAKPGFDGFLAQLSASHRENFRRDLRRAEKAGVEIRYTTEPSAQLLDEMSRLYSELLENKHDVFTYKTNLFSALAKRMPRNSVSCVTCHQGDTLLGFFISHPAAKTTRALYVGYSTATSVHGVYFMLFAAFLRSAIDDGATRLMLGFTSDEYKKRLGTTAVPHVRFIQRVEPAP